MWSAVKDLSNEALTSFDIENDLVQVSSAQTSYGVIVLGKIRVRGVDDGYLHVR